MWTEFWDMHSGGHLKLEPYSRIYIEAPYDQAMIIFYNRFGRHPLQVTCGCCGEDYGIHESNNLKQATAYLRNCIYKYDGGEYVERPDKGYELRYTTIDELTLTGKTKDGEKVLILPIESVRSEELTGYLPEIDDYEYEYEYEDYD